MRRSIVGLALGVLLSLSALCAAPAMAIEPTALLTAAVISAPEKAVNSDQTLSTAIKAQHATASAPAERLCSSTSATVSVGLAVHSTGVLALRDPGDEGDGGEATGTESLIAQGVDPGDGDADTTASRLAA